MARTVVNSLSGPVGAAPSTSSLAATARVGTVGVVAPGRSDYSAAETVHGLSTVRVDTGFHRSNSTPRLETVLPAAPWWIRFYTRLPQMQDAGHGIDECRWVCRVGTVGLVLHETANGNIGLRLQPDGLAQDPINPALDGTAVPIGQWLRVELSSDGTDTVCEVYPGHATTGPRIATWSGTALSGDMELSAYRYRRGVLLQPGDNDANLDGTPIQDRQEQLLAWNPDALPQYGADGDFGNETTTWVQNFQETHGFALVDGEIGSETGAAMDLAAAEANGDPLPSPTWLSYLAIDDATSLVRPPHPVRPFRFRPRARATRADTRPAHVPCPYLLEPHHPW